MKKMKKIGLTLSILALLLVVPFVLVGCGGGPARPADIEFDTTGDNPVISFELPEDTFTETSARIHGFVLRLAGSSATVFIPSDFIEDALDTELAGEVEFTLTENLLTSVSFLFTRCPSSISDSRLMAIFDAYDDGESLAGFSEVTTTVPTGDLVVSVRTVSARITATSHSVSASSWANVGTWDRTPATTPDAD